MKRLLLLIFSLVFAFALCQGQYPGIIAGSNAAAYGAEKITDGDFPDNTNWTEGTSWLIGGEVATYDDLANSTMSQPDITMVSVMAVYTTYKLEFDIVIGGGGTASIKFQNQDGTIVYVAQTSYSNGHANFEFETGADVSDGGFGIRAYTASTATFTIDNVSLMEKL